jgi:hypothetical protein
VVTCSHSVTALRLLYLPVARSLACQVHPQFIPSSLSRAYDDPLCISTTSLSWICVPFTRFAHACTAIALHTTKWKRQSKPDCDPSLLLSVTVSFSPLLRGASCRAPVADAHIGRGTTGPIRRLPVGLSDVECSWTHEKSLCSRLPLAYSLPILLALMPPPHTSVSGILFRGVLLRMYPHPSVRLGGRSPCLA